MRTLLPIAALFWVGSLQAQSGFPSGGRELPRGTLLIYPTAAEARAADTTDHRYFTRLTGWNCSTEECSTGFSVPFLWANRQVVLHVSHVPSGYEVRVNDRSVGRVAEGHSPAEYNITKFVNEGPNRLSIHAMDPAATDLLENWEKTSEPQLGPVWIQCLPTLHVRDVLVSTRMAEDGSATAEVAVVMKSDALNPRTSQLHYSLLDPSGQSVTTGYKEITLSMRQEDTLRFVARIPPHLLWDCELPTQYLLRLRTRHEGRDVEHAELRLGFREVRIDRDTLRINGNPTRLQVRDVPATISKNEVALLREQGCNTLQLRPGPVPDSLLDFCDAQGMYVIVQAPIDTHRSGLSRRKGGNPSNDPAWKKAYLERTQNTYHTTKRHPSVIAFSLARHSANGINLYESYLALKRLGDQRPVIYPEAGGEWNSDPLPFTDFVPSLPSDPNDDPTATEPTPLTAPEAPTNEASADEATADVPPTPEAAPEAAQSEA